MATATNPYYERIAIIFDFDDTLAPDSFRSLLESCGIDNDTFQRERVQPLIDDGWDEILAKMYCIIKESQRREDITITDKHLAKVGREIRFFDGILEMFDRVKTCARNVIPDVEVEFHLISSGILEIARATPIADRFKEMWGCEFHFNDNGEIEFVKRIITHPEKVRYLLQIAKGVSKRGSKGRPRDVYRDVPADEWHIPLNQIVYIGDGGSDMPVFHLMHQHRGMAIGVFKGDVAANWKHYKAMKSDRHIENLAPVDYSEGSELMQSLMLAVESICKELALRKLSTGE